MQTSRYSRQTRLRDVGTAGQARIRAAALEVRGREGALVEFIYLERAGVDAIVIAPNEPAEPFAHAAEFSFAPAREIGAGAWRALQKLRRVLGVETPPA